MSLFPASQVMTYSPEEHLSTDTWQQGLASVPVPDYLTTFYVAKLFSYLGNMAEGTEKYSYMNFPCLFLVYDTWKSDILCSCNSRAPLESDLSILVLEHL